MRFLLLVFGATLLSLSSACDLGQKSGCFADADCMEGLTCIEGSCHECVGDLVGCACVNETCLNGLLCGPEDMCVTCSADVPCAPGLVCEQGDCVPCTSEYAGCPCETGACGTDLRCSESNVCIALQCDDQTQNGDETDVDCGGSCAPCEESQGCANPSDCSSLSCRDGSCLAIGHCLVKSTAFPSIQSALDDPSCETIQLEADAYGENLTISRGVEIVGVGNDTVLTPAARAPIITAPEGEGLVVLRSLKMQDGEATDAGAAIRTWRDMTIEDVWFVDNRVRTDAPVDSPRLPVGGGAIWASDSALTIANSGFIRNEVIHNYTFDERAMFSQSVYANGGAISTREGELYVAWTLFEGNRVQLAANIVTPNNLSGSADLVASGGAISSLASTPEETEFRIHGSTFRRNDASVYVEGFQSGGFMFARALGGAVRASGVDVWIGNNTMFDRNQAAVDATRASEAIAHASGGGVYQSYGPIGNWPTLDRGVQFLDNAALAEGIRRTIAEGGAARFRGHIRRTEFWRNAALGNVSSGGALLVHGETRVHNSLFWKNSASSGSAVVFDTSGHNVPSVYDLWLINSTVLANDPDSTIETDTGLIHLHHVAMDYGRLRCEGTGSIQSEGYNLLPLDFGCAELTASDRPVGDPMLQDGVSATARPWATSPAIAGGDPNGCIGSIDQPIPWDLVDTPREGPCTIGAYTSVVERYAESFRTTLLTLPQPNFYADPDRLESCSDPINATVQAMVQSAMSNDHVPATPANDGLYDLSFLFRRQVDHDGGPHAYVESSACSVWSTTCARWTVVDPTTRLNDYAVSQTEDCVIADGAISVSAGPHGCFVARHDEPVTIDLGFPVRLHDFEMLGQYEVQPSRIVNGTIRGFLSHEDALASPMPIHAQPLLGGAETLADLLCAAELSSRDGIPGFEFEIGVTMEHVSGAWGVGALPPPRPELDQ